MERVWELPRRDGWHDHGPVPPARLLARLLARALHDGRRLHRGRDALLRPPLGHGLDLSREPDRQLVPVPRDGDLRPRGRPRGAGRRAHLRSRYPFADGSGSLTIATVRPATMLADVAVAVHPDDERYRDAIGRDVIVPFVDRPVPVIADEASSQSSAPARSRSRRATTRPTSRSAATRPPEPTVIGLDGRMNAEAGELAGLTQQEADDRVVEWLQEHDRLEKRESYRHSVGTCQRCHTRIEPLVSLQWWCAMEEPRSPRSRRCGNARSATTPSRSTSSRSARSRTSRTGASPRQLWWGHQLPIWYCPDGHDLCLASARGLWICASTRADPRPGRARHLVLVRALALRHPRLAGADARARALLPGRRERDRAGHHPALGGPDDLDRSGADGRAAVQRRDHHLDDPRADGRRMSKSLGTGLDPLDSVERHGATRPATGP